MRVVKVSDGSQEDLIAAKGTLPVTVTVWLAEVGPKHRTQKLKE